MCKGFYPLNFIFVLSLGRIAGSKGDLIFALLVQYAAAVGDL